eukprot:GDKH01000471.1.p3 GENE.GDKH01000471.1~~GDKH01000471.1.p3  ORF type:complete len:50 (-),score=3.70 GDKH01000471.1:90-239(-)
MALMGGHAVVSVEGGVVVDGGRCCVAKWGRGHYSGPIISGRLHHRVHCA